MLDQTDVDIMVAGAPGKVLEEREVQYRYCAALSG
jgi:hypothetical protein